MSVVQPAHHYWFPAKDFGWGWTLPDSWQGWSVLIAYALVIVGLRQRFWASGAKQRFWGLFAIATATLLLIMYMTGEPPGWRWGS